MTCSALIAKNKDRFVTAAFEYMAQRNANRFQTELLKEHNEAQRRKYQKDYELDECNLIVRTDKTRPALFITSESLNAKDQFSDKVKFNDAC